MCHRSILSPPHHRELPPSSIKRHTLLIPRAFPAEDVQRAADRDIDPAFADLLHAMQVMHAARAACIRHRFFAPQAEAAHERLVDPLALALHVNGVDENLVAMW